LKDYTVIQKAYKDIESELKKWETDRIVNTYTTILLSYYDKGYKLGAAKPDFYNSETDLFKLAEEWRRKALQRKMNNNIIKISGL